MVLLFIYVHDVRHCHILYILKPTTTLSVLLPLVLALRLASQLSCTCGKVAAVDYLLTTNELCAV